MAEFAHAAEFVVRIPGRPEERRPLPAAGGVIGRAPAADIRIAHPSISRRHARVDLAADGSWHILDLGSRNGLIVRSRRAAEAHLHDGDTLQLGDVVLHLVVATAAETPPASPVGSPDPEAAPTAGTPPPPSPPSPPWLESSEELPSSTVSPSNSGPSPAEDPRLALLEDLGLVDRDGDRPRAEGPDPGAPDSLPPTRDLESVAFLPDPSDVPPSGGPDTRPLRTPGAASSAESDADRTRALPGTVHRDRGDPDRRDPDLLDPADLAGAAPTGAPLFRRSERWMLIAVGLLASAAVLLLTLGPRDRAPLSPGGGSGDLGSRARGAVPREADGRAGRRGGEATPTRDPSASSATPGRTNPAVPPVPPRALADRLLALPDGAIDRAWNAAVFLLGRAPTPSETCLFGEGGADALLAAARALPEHWRHRARVALAGSELPESLLPDEVPLDLGTWAALIRERQGDVPGPPLPGAGGTDLAYEAAYRRALDGRESRTESMSIDGLAAALRSVWTAGAGRTLDDEVERWVDELARSGLPGDLLVGRFLSLAAGAHPLVRAAPAKGFDPRDFLPRLDRETEWPDGADDAEVPADLRWAAALDRLLPRFPEEDAPIGPPGSLRVEVLAPFSVRAHLADPARIPRLWRRLEGSRLTLCASGSSSPAALHARFSTPSADEAWVIGEGARPESPTDRSRWRVADGYLLPALADAAAHLGPIPTRDAFPEPVAEWWERARPGRSPAGLRLFKAGGYRLVPGEWRAAAYRPPTRALLLAGAHLLERPGTDVVARVVLTEAPSEGPDGEWAEWMTALELVAGRCDGHPVTLWFYEPAGEGGSRGTEVEWGPEVRRGWVIEESRPADELHPEASVRTDETADPTGTTGPAETGGGER